MKSGIYLVLLGVMSLPTMASDAGTCDIAEIVGCNQDISYTETDDKKSGWTFGMGAAAAVNIPEYIGSDESRSFVLPVPYINYTSPKLKIGQGGIVGKLFESDKWFLSLSLSGAIPVDSDDNEARKGMPDIEAVFEYGPSLQYYLMGTNDAADAIFIDFNFREARTLSFDTLDVSASPAVVVRQKLDKPLFGGKVNWVVRYKQEFVSNRYAQYFYGVESEYATAERPVYEASGGNGGYRVTSSVRWQKGKHIVSGFFVYADLFSADYADSPLVKTKHHSYGGISYFKLF